MSWDEGEVSPALLDAGVYVGRAKRPLAEELGRAIRRVSGGGAGRWDFSPVWLRPRLVARATERVAEHAARAGAEAVVGVEGEGLIVAAGVAGHLDLPLALLRRKGRGAPPEAGATGEDSGSPRLEVVTDSVRSGRRFYLAHHALLRSGTVPAAIRLLKRLDGRVAGVGALARSREIPDMLYTLNSLFITSLQ